MGKGAGLGHFDEAEHLVGGSSDSLSGISSFKGIGSLDSSSFDGVSSSRIRGQSLERSDSTGRVSGTQDLDSQLQRPDRRHIGGTNGDNLSQDRDTGAIQGSELGQEEQNPLLGDFLVLVSSALYGEE